MDRRCRLNQRAAAQAAGSSLGRDGAPRTPADITVAGRCLALLVVGLVIGGPPGCAWSRPKLPALLTRSAPAKGDLEGDLSLARLSERHGKVDQARALYESVLKREPTNQLCHHRLGVIAAQQGRLDEALTLLTKAESMGPSSSGLSGDVGYVHFLKGDFETAQSRLQDAVAMDRGNKTAINNLGIVLAAQGRYAEGLAKFREVTTEPRALANLAYVQSQVGDLAAATASYHAALDLDPTLKSAAEALIALNQRAPTSAPRLRNPARPVLAQHPASPQTWPSGQEFHETHSGLARGAQPYASPAAAAPVQMAGATLPVAAPEGVILSSHALPADHARQESAPDLAQVGQPVRVPAAVARAGRWNDGDHPPAALEAISQTSYAGPPHAVPDSASEPVPDRGLESSWDSSAPPRTPQESAPAAVSLNAAPVPLGRPLGDPRDQCVPSNHAPEPLDLMQLPYSADGPFTP